MQHSAQLHYLTSHFDDIVGVVKSNLFITLLQLSLRAKRKFPVDNVIKSHPSPRMRRVNKLERLSSENIVFL